MIDTIVLILNQNQFEITQHDKFNPSTIGLFQSPFVRLGANAHYKCYQNPLKSEFVAGNYKPRLTVTKRMSRGGFLLTLKIEFSIPKLMHGNNFAEVADNDFTGIIKKLRDKLEEMGVYVTIFQLRRAEVSSIHFSKNIILEEFMTSSMIINELKKINLTKRLDLSNTDFRNEGHILHYHANSYEVVFYDKIKDMQQSMTSDKRAIEKDNVIQLELFKSLASKKPLQVMRMEVRLGNRAKIKSLFGSLKLPIELTFEKLFKQSISKKVILHYWQNSTRDIVIVDDSNKPEELFNKIMASNKGIKPNKALSVLSGLLLINSVGIRGFRALLISCCSDRNLQRIVKQIKSIVLPSGYKHFAINYVKTTLEDFKQITIEDYNDYKKGLDNACKQM